MEHLNLAGPSQLEIWDFKSSSFSTEMGYHNQDSRWISTVCLEAIVMPHPVEAFFGYFLFAADLAAATRGARKSEHSKSHSTKS